MTRFNVWLNARFMHVSLYRSMLNFFFLLIGFLGVLPSRLVAAETKPTWPYTHETKEQRDVRMQWWRDARFGMFIHWGVYAVPAGTYNEKQIGGIGEWIMFQGEIPVKEYKAYAKQFNPVKYDPDAWVQLAKEAGMKYIVITSKHHDGFALFDSKVTDWDIVDATPYGKDLLKPLAEACRKHGLKLGFYYSQAQDWCHPGGAKAGGKQWDPAQAGDMDQYLRQIAVPQVKEILSNYGDIAVLWWDTPSDMNRERAAMFEPVVSQFPNIITNNRLGGGYRGDSETPEQHIPATGYKDRDWETCMTLNDTWGFKSYDHNWKSTQTVIRNLVDIASKGGNYLLNVGPTAEGEIPQPSIERLKEVGQWMRINGDAIYGTTASPFAKLEWGRCTKKVHQDGTTLYLHVFDWPKDGKLMVPGLKNKIKSAHLTASNQAIQAESVSDGVMLSLPQACPDSIATVITVETEGDLEIEKILPKQSEDGTILLPASIADIHNRMESDTQVESKDNIPNIGYWTDAQSWVEWQFKIERPGVFAVTAQIASPAQDSRAEIKVGDAVLPVTFPATGSYDTFQTHQLGTITIEKAGNCALQIRPVGSSWKPINVRFIMLSLVPPVAVETPAQRDARMQWWRQARFGMFVHWGLYSGLAGTWEGKAVGTRGGMEWIQNYVGADTATYAQRAIPLFKPSQTFAAEWAALAKTAGCRYLVFTTKHHDGFALHDSQVSDYDAGSILKRDLVREIVDAARAADLRVGFYHSVIDWHHDQYDYSLSRQLPHPLKSKGAPVPPRNHAEYLDYLNAQVNELISNYGTVDVMWWDFSAQDFQGQTAWRAFDLMNAVRAKQPAIIMNNRLFRIPEAGWASMGTDGYTMTLNPIYGDFITPEQHIPDTGISGIDWETCMTMNTTWGYSEHDNAWKSSETLIRNLVDIVSKGGNYLLNIGPKADGSIPLESIKAMQAVGRWMEVNGEAIYDTSASPFEKLQWGRCTQKVADGGTTLYLHVFDWPKDGILRVPGLKNKVTSARLLATGQTLKPEAGGDGVALTVPAASPDPVAAVVEVRIEGPLTVEKAWPKQADDGTITLPALLADIYNVQGTNTQVELKQDIYNIGHWTGSQCRVQWQFRIDRPGIFEVAGQISIQGESRAELKIGDKTLTAVFAATGSYDNFQTQRLGTIAIEKPGLYTFEICPDKDAWNPINVRLLTLTPLVGPRAETKAQFDARMQWWREARFGMFIHWGIYAVPAGEWKGKTNYAEWIMEQAQIPLEQYEPFCEQFNPTQFDADAWVKMARDAGMKYLVITSKHHDGFCLWDSAVGDYTVVKRTPFKRDILAELAKACKTYDVRLCFYHSIMDWHHPDYLPRRNWEKRSPEGADYSRYIAYMKAQLKELITRYDPGVLWFDGEWESTWTHEMGLDLYDYVRSLKPDIIINNRVDKGRRGMQGTYETSQFAGDFGTPEQEIPATGLDYDWESCITMNGHWGWNKNDKNFKSAEEMIRSLVDIASKGGNYLLNIGPKPDGTFPQESIERLAQMGQWMKVNGESIYGTSAGPFVKLDWGRCTQKQDGKDTLLYLHVFSAPADGTLTVSGLKNEILQATLLAAQQSLTAARSDNGVIVQLPAALPDAVDTVIVLKIKGRPRVEAAAGAL